MNEWKIQDAKQRFSELIRVVEASGPQVVTRHGRPVAVVVEIEDWHTCIGADEAPDFKGFLLAGPVVDELPIERDSAPAPIVEFRGES